MWLALTNKKDTNKMNKAAMVNYNVNDKIEEKINNLLKMLHVLHEN